MQDKIFFDSNILIYAFSIDEPVKKNIVDHLIESDYAIILSTQVINEFVYVMNRKRKFSFDELAVTVKELKANFPIVPISMDTIQQALKISQQHKYSYFDSLMIASALEHGCTIICSEDMHNTHVIDDKLRIMNPFTQKS